MWSWKWRAGGWRNSKVRSRPSFSASLLSIGSFVGGRGRGNLGARLRPVEVRRPRGEENKEEGKERTTRRKKRGSEGERTISRPLDSRVSRATRGQERNSRAANILPASVASLRSISGFRESAADADATVEIYDQSSPPFRKELSIATDKKSPIFQGDQHRERIKSLFILRRRAKLKDFRLPSRPCFSP